MFGALVLSVSYMTGKMLDPCQNTSEGRIDSDQNLKEGYLFFQHAQWQASFNYRCSDEKQRARNRTSPRVWRVLSSHITVRQLQGWLLPACTVIRMFIFEAERKGGFDKSNGQPTSLSHTQSGGSSTVSK